MPHFVNLNALPLQQVRLFIQRALDLKAGQPHQSLQGTVSNLFFENSTRTQASFQMAENRLGLQQVMIDPATSSVGKGESFGDTLKTLKAIGVDAVVIRHAQNAWYEALLNQDQVGAPIPLLINAGDGSGQHPSQSLLDLVTIQEAFGHIDGLRIRIVGDLSHSRVARSNAEILNKLGAIVTFSGPEAWYPQDFNQFGQYVALDDDLAQQDVVMFLRVQHERLQADEQPVASEAYHQLYGLTLERYAMLNDNAIVMHPAPVNRDVEIADALVEAPKSRIFNQMTNGVYARMAILEYVLGGE